MFKGVWKKKLRLALTFIGVAVGIAICVLMLGISEGIRSAFHNAYKDRDIDIVVFEKDQFDIMASRIDDSFVGEIKNMPEVEHAGGVLLDFFKYQTSFLPIYGWPTDCPQFAHIKMIEGRLPDENKNEIILGDFFAHNSGEGVGKILKIKSAPFEVVGIYESNSSFEKSAIIMPLKRLQQIGMNNEGKIVGINITLKNQFRNQKSIDSVIGHINTKYDLLTAQPADIFIAEKTKLIIMGEKFTWMVAAIAIIAVVLGLTNTMLTHVYEQKKHIGMLMVMGWEKKDVMKLFFAEAMIIIFAGSFLGILIGSCGTNYIFSLMDVGVFAPVLNCQLLFKITLLALITGAASSIMPLSVILNLNPIEVIKSE